MTGRFQTEENTEIYYYIEGEGYPLLFIHGLGGSLNNWNESYLYFLKKGFQVIGIDLPGYGKSSKHEDFEYTISHYAKIVKEFLHFLKLKCPPILVGNSMGGQISSYFAAKYKSRLKALILVDSSGLNEMNLFQEVLIHFTFEKNNIAQILKYMIDIFSFNIFNNPKHPNAQTFIEEQKEMSKEEHYHGYCYALNQSTKAMMNAGLKDLLSEIQVPVMIIWGKNDRLIPSFYSEKFLEAIPGSSLKLIQNCGHVPQLEKPEEFNLYLEQFLNSILSAEEKTFFSKQNKFKNLITKIFKKGKTC